MPTAYITTPPAVAEEIARTIVEERLAACVNRFECQSIYRWDEEVHAEDEVVLLAKTSMTAWPSLRDRVTALHPHDVPCVELFEETDELEEFVEWREAAVG